MISASSENTLDTLIVKPKRDHLVSKSIKLCIFWILLELALAWNTFITNHAGHEKVICFIGFTVILPIFLIYALVPLFPEEGRLTLNEDGFILYSHLPERRRTCQWNEIKTIFFKNWDAGPLKLPRIGVILHRPGFVETFHLPPYRYHNSPEETVTLLQQWKSQHTSISEAELNAYLFPKDALRPPIADRKIEKLTNRWSLPFFGILIIILLGAFFYTDAIERSTFKFYNFYTGEQPQFTLTVRKEYSTDWDVYPLPPLLYRHQQVIRIPSPDLYVPIRVQYLLNHKTQCAYLQKARGSWGQMDAMWINPEGKLDAYAADYCQRKSYRLRQYKTPCQMLPGQVIFTPCENLDIPIKKQHIQPVPSREASLQIKPLGALDYKRLKEKKGIVY